MHKLSTKISVLVLGAAFLFSVLVACGCGSSGDVQPDAKSNYSAPISKKKQPGPSATE